MFLFRTITFFSELSNLPDNDSSYCLFIFLALSPAALILVVLSGLVTWQAGCIADTLGFPITIILGIPSMSFLCSVSRALGPVPASSLVYSLVLLSLTAASEIGYGWEVLRFCLLVRDIFYLLPPLLPLQSAVTSLPE